VKEVQNAASPAETTAAQKRRERRERRRHRVLKAVLSTPEGREYLWDLIARAGVYETPFAIEPVLMAFKAGRQNFGLEIVKELTQNHPAEFLAMEREARSRQQAHESEVIAARVNAARETDTNDEN
jgi:hypothetical protein